MLIKVSAVNCNIWTPLTSFYSFVSITNSKAQLITNQSRICQSIVQKMENKNLKHQMDPFLPLYSFITRQDGGGPEGGLPDLALDRCQDHHANPQ
jgi:hypothetical protein